MKIKDLISVILFSILVSSFVYAESGLVYSLTLGYDGTTITNEGLILIEGNAPKRLNQPETGFILKVVDFEGNILHSFKFLIETMPAREAPVEIFDETGAQIGMPEDTTTVPTQTEIVLVIPYFENTKTIEIFSEAGQLMLSIDVSKYSKTTTSPTDFTLLIYILIAAIVIVVVALGIMFYVKKISIKTKITKSSKKLK